MNANYKSLQELTNKIETLTIGALRDLAREFGIVPSNRKRGELIRLITGVYLGEVNPEPRKKKGRPPNVEKSDESVGQNKPEIDDDTVSAAEETEEGEGGGSHEYVYFDTDPNRPDTGILEVLPDGYGFVRTRNYSTTAGKDYYIPATTITRMGVRSGDKVKVILRSFPNRTAPTVVYISEINDMPCSKSFQRTPFEALEPCFPNERIALETDKTEYSLRAIDLVAPIGKGQRGLIVAPPKAGKTILLKKIAMAVRRNHPEIHLTVLLIDERPEEVTDFKESVDCEVVYSTFDQQPSNHTRIAELVISNAKRRVEQGQDVMVLMDSITRLGRAYNQTAEQSGRTLTGGLDVSALQEPKKLFGAGRNTRSGGSLTILATALIDTGSKMDDIIYEEFKGTGNMEIHLDRRMSEKRIFPAIDLNRSSTRREEMLLTQSQLEGMYIARRMLANTDPVTATEELLEVIMMTENNDEAIDMLKRLMRSSSNRNAMKLKQ